MVLGNPRAEDDPDFTGKSLDTGSCLVSELFSWGKEPRVLFGSGGKLFYRLKTSKTQGLEVGKLT